MLTFRKKSWWARNVDIPTAGVEPGAFTSEVTEIEVICKRRISCSEIKIINQICKIKLNHEKKSPERDPDSAKDASNRPRSSQKKIL